MADRVSVTGQGMEGTAKALYEPRDRRTGIYEALPKIIGEMPVIAKGRQNQAQRFNFRGIDDVYSALNLLLFKHGVTIVPRVISSESEAHESKSGGKMFRVRSRVEFTLYASDGSFICAVTEGEAMDSGDKATPKSLSMAYKYMAFQVFCIPSGEKIDTEEDSPEVRGGSSTDRAPGRNPGDGGSSPSRPIPGQSRPATPGGQSTEEPPLPGDPDAPPGLEGANSPSLGSAPVQGGLFTEVFEGFKKRLLATPKGGEGFAERMKISRDVLEAKRNGQLVEDQLKELRNIADAKR